METLAEFQERNCRGCLYADRKKMGTGKPCCTRPLPTIVNGQCLNRREENHDSNRRITGSH